MAKCFAQSNRNSFHGHENQLFLGGLAVQRCWPRTLPKNNIDYELCIESLV